MMMSEGKPATSALLAQQRFRTDCSSFSPSYDQDEPDYDPEEPIEPYDAEDGANGETNGVHNELDQMETGEDGRKVIASGDPSAGAARGQSGVAPKDKKIPNDQRCTTPYMTKYERARVLGTRALQIRYV
jgi:DNA-directed RNA polymerase I, II, and III subunit RPABC2